MGRLAFIAAFAFSAVAFAKTPIAPVANPGALVVHCSTEGAEVFVDGNKVGTTPLGPQVLTPGEHTVKIVKLGFAPLIDVFTINKKKETRLDVELVPVAGVVKISANVEQSHVFVDGKFVGEAPITVEVQVGARAIQVSKGGFKDFFQNVEAVAGQEVSIEVMLEELPMGANPYKPTPPPPPKWYEKWWVWTAAGGAVAVGVVAVVVGVTQANKNEISDFGPHYTFTVNNSGK
jgi:hypothetical protein